jgi:hypothetical protein
MARFLSADWFAEIASHMPARPNGGPRIVLEQVVRDTPDGEVRYRVVAADGTAYIEPAVAQGAGDGAGRADLTIACDWATAAAMAQGRLSAQAALLAGRLRVHGNLSRLSGWASDLVGLDPVPPEVRRRTTY